MASTNKTANLGLNQWVARDTFQMADFNADNAKIDAALGEQRGGVVKLFDVTITQDTDSVEIDLSGKDLAGFVELHLHMPLMMGVKPNEYTGKYDYCTSSSSWMNKQVNPIFYTGFCIIRNTHGLDSTEGNIFFSGQNVYFAPASSVGKLEKLTIRNYNSEPLKAGDRIILLGFKY